MRKLKFDLLISNLGFRVILMMKLNLLNAMTQLYKIIIKWLEYQDKPDNELFLMSKAAKAYWINKELFILDQDGLLWKQDEATKVLVLPSTMIAEVMNLCHDVPSTGHQGVSRTLSRVKERFYWHTLSTDVQNYVASCAVCNRNKKPKR